MTVLVDYYGQEVTDALAVCNRFPDSAQDGRLAVRLDTHGGRYVEGLDPQASYAVLERHVPNAIRQYRPEAEQIGRAACRERGCPYVWISVVDGSLKKKTKTKIIVEYIQR